MSGLQSWVTQRTALFVCMVSPIVFKLVVCNVGCQGGGVAHSVTQIILLILLCMGKYDLLS